jgi:hypothetical protein
MNFIAYEPVARRAGQHITRFPMLWAFVDTAVVFGALGWLYVAVVAVVYPGELSFPIVVGIPIRRDTLAIICFGVSAVAYFLREIRKQSSGSRDAFSRRTVARASLRTIFVYSTMTAIYLMANSITHPKTMTMPLTHVVDWPTEGTVFAFASFCSVLSFFFLRVSVHVPRIAQGVDAW